MGRQRLFFKQVRELHRHSPLVFWGGSTIMLAAVGAFISVVMMNAGDDGEPMSANLIMMIATITSIYVQFFLNAAGPWSKEMMKPYLYMVPQSPFKKLFFASLTSLLTPIADGIVVFPLIGILVKASPLTVIICFLMFISFGFLYTSLNIAFRAAVRPDGQQRADFDAVRPGADGLHRSRRGHRRRPWRGPCTLRRL